MAATEEAIYRRIKEAIIRHRLPPGTRLGEEALADAFGVSRTPLRNVLRRLAYEKLVVVERNRGASVCCPTAEDARETFEMRRVLEDAVVERVVSKVTDADLRRLRRLVEVEHRAFERGDLPGALRIAGDLHLELARLAGNTLFVRYLEEVISLSYVILALYGRDPEEICSESDHDELLAAVAARDSRAARAIMRRHLDRMMRNLDYGRPAGQAVDFRAIFGDGAGVSADRQPDAGTEAPAEAAGPRAKGAVARRRRGAAATRERRR